MAQQLSDQPGAILFMIPMVQDPLGLELGKQRVALLVVPRKWKVAALQD
jgi:hypothetical protein